MSASLAALEALGAAPASELASGRAEWTAAPALEAAALFARLGALADEVLAAITRGDEAGMHAALDERDRIGARLDPLVVAIRAEGVARRMGGASAGHARDGEIAAEVWAAAKDAERRHGELTRELEARREAVARELAGLREARGGYAAPEAARASSLNLIR